MNGNKIPQTLNDLPRLHQMSIGSIAEIPENHQMIKEAEFTRLYEQFAPGILKLCKGYTGDNALAEDLLHETFISVWNNMDKFRSDASWGTWIYRIGVNTCLSYFRKKKLSTIDIDYPAVERVPHVNDDTEKNIQLLYKSISRLEKTDRLIISLVLEDKPYPDISAILGITENNLRVKIHRIKKQLTEIYNSYARL